MSHLVGDAGIGIADSPAFEHGSAAGGEAEARGDIEQFPALHPIFIAPGSQPCRPADHPPGAVRMCCRVQRSGQPGSCSDIIADDKGPQEFTPEALLLLASARSAGKHASQDARGQTGGLHPFQALFLLSH